MDNTESAGQNSNPSNVWLCYMYSLCPKNVFVEKINNSVTCFLAFPGHLVADEIEGNGQDLDSLIWDHMGETFWASRLGKLS